MRRGEVVFVSEERLGFGSFASSNIAQRCSNAIFRWTLKEFDQLEQLERKRVPSPRWQQWGTGRVGLETQCRRERPRRRGMAEADCNQSRLAIIPMFTDDPVAIVVGAQRALRILRSWHTKTGSVNLTMAEAEKRQIGSHVEWI